jgi:SAM-dependent methyltransferase
MRDSAVLSLPPALAQAQQLASQARFDDFLLNCQQIIDRCSDDPDTLLDVGALLFSFGFLAAARQCFMRVRSLAPKDLRPLVNLANLARDAGDHAESRRLYAALLGQLPDQPVIRRNALVSLEYDPEVSAGERLAYAKAWGEWAIAKAGGLRPRPALRTLQGRPLRVGYVSADFCQHTVGLFVKDVLIAHDHAKILPFAYSAGQVNDWVTAAIRNACSFRDVSTLDDAALAEQIREDEIDVLVDLSGHTAGSRLTIFAYRPAPVQVLWLGYFATTGLSCMDAVLLDDWHAPQGAEAQFVEAIVGLPGGRFCYTPVPFAPAKVAPPPCIATGYVTFGSFNNTAKLNPGVFEVWSRVLAAAPDSRLMLKWRTFQDEALCQSVCEAFAQRGITPERIELRGASFHADVMKEYADIDIALDPFPFTGGLTSCEALWMGVPVVTWPQSRVVSRQTFAFLSAIGLPELAAQDAEGYVRIAVELGGDRERLVALRNEMRTRMEASPLMDVPAFTRQLEQCLIELYQDIYAREKDRPMTSPKTLLNVGAGHPKSGAKIPRAFQTPDWKELRLDIDPANEPDILGTMLDMSAVADESVDAIYSSHNIEHLYPNEIPTALKEFLRVLKPDGFAVITCPDLQAAAQMIAEDKLMEVAYSSPAGPVTPFDIVYSHRNFTGRDKPFMAHHCGFTLKVLIGTLKSNGFPSVAGKRRPAAIDLWVVASKGPIADVVLRELAGKVLPG